MRIFVSGVRKLFRRLATWLTFGILVGLLVLIFVAVGATAQEAAEAPNGGGGPEVLLLLSFPGAYDNVLSFILGLGGLLAVIYGAAIAGSEWTWGTLKSAVARGESRSRYMLVTFGSIVLLVGIGLVLAFAVGVGAALLGANLAGVSTDGLTDTDALRALPEKLARTWVAIASVGALGYAIATLTRSQLAGIGAGVALFFGEQFAGIFFPDVVKYLPFDAATAVLATPNLGGGGPVVQALEPNLALLVVGAWLLGALLVAALFTERAEISG